MIKYEYKMKITQFQSNLIVVLLFSNMNTFLKILRIQLGRLNYSALGSRRILIYWRGFYVLIFLPFWVLYLIHKLFFLLFRYLNSLFFYKTVEKLPFFNLIYNMDYNYALSTFLLQLSKNHNYIPFNINL